MIEILNGTHETVSYSEKSGVSLYHNHEAEDYPVHWHIAFEIIMPCKGGYSVSIASEKITFSEGDILLIPPGELHALFAPPSGERLIMLFDYTLIFNLPGMDSLLHLFHPYKLIRRTEYPDLAGQLQRCFLEIESEYTTEQPFVESSIYALLLRLFVAIGRASICGSSRFPNTTPGKQHEYVAKFLSICNYISEHCTEALTVDDLAAQAGFSKFHFSRLFKQFAGISCYDYLISKRIAYAERLLNLPDLSITEVAAQAGFNSLSTFNRVFKAAKNCSPSEYKSLRSTHD